MEVAMRIVRKSSYYLSLFVLTLSPLSAKVDYRVEDQPIAFEGPDQLCRPLTLLSRASKTTAHVSVHAPLEPDC